MNRISMASLIAVPLLTLCAGTASAQDWGPALVWGVSAVSDVSQTSIDRVSSRLAKEVARTTGIQVLDEDIVDEGMGIAMDFGFCAENDNACIVEVGREIDAAEAVSGDLGKVGRVWILTIRRIDVYSGNVIRQVTGQTDEGLTVLLRSMSDMVASLYNIPHDSIGIVRDHRYDDGVAYQIITYGRPFRWVRPVVHVGSYPWWWSGPTRYYHHHSRWRGWHHRHPGPRPRPAHPTHHKRYRSRPSRPHHGAPHHNVHHNGPRRDRHDRGHINRHPSGRAAPKVDSRPPAGRRHDSGVSRPRHSDRPGRSVDAPRPGRKPPAKNDGKKKKSKKDKRDKRNKKAPARHR